MSWTAYLIIAILVYMFLLSAGGAVISRSTEDLNEGERSSVAIFFAIIAFMTALLWPVGLPVFLGIGYLRMRGKRGQSEE